MTETAARPWWADVQHLRPREDRAEHAPARTWADDADFTDALKSVTSDAGFGGDLGADAFMSDRAPDASALAVLDLPAVEEALSAVESPLPIAFDVDELDWAPGQRFARASEDLDFARAGRFARAAAHAVAPELVPEPAFSPEPTRRTVEIRGQVDTRATAPAVGQDAGRQRYRRQRATPAERLAGRPDRVAMWAVVLGIVLILVAAFSAPGAEAAVIAGL